MHNGCKLLDKTDILKGKWVDLPKRKKLLASFFMGLWIFMLLLFDLFIKVLNALTLSLNTFTTLGFGDIPTKGLPRYLSIVQGFIGWFMLSIFSVSLISQLLN
jgi:small-conductance mechanosensitive channel